MSTLAPRLTADEVTAFLAAAFPPDTGGVPATVEAVAPGRLRMRLEPRPAMRRPGNIVAGPTLMTLADVAAYAIVAAHHGAEEMAVTTTLSIAFLRACRFEPVLADATLLKLGRRLASVDVRIWQRDETRVIAQATVGYALP